MKERIFAKPVIITERDLAAKLLPYIGSYPWALDTIGDLWRMGAPDPQTQVGTPYERRIILPSQFKVWWEDVNQRMGAGLTPAQVLRVR